MDIRKVLTIPKFRAWLESKSPRTKVGRPGNCESCPLAKFLTQTAEPITQWDVDSVISDGYTAYPLPVWADKFMHLVDIEPGYSVSAQKCLALLKQVA